MSDAMAAAGESKERAQTAPAASVPQLSGWGRDYRPGRELLSEDLETATVGATSHRTGPLCHILCGKILVNIVQTPLDHIFFIRVVKGFSHGRIIALGPVISGLYSLSRGPESLSVSTTGLLYVRLETAQTTNHSPCL